MSTASYTLRFGLTAIDIVGIHDRPTAVQHDGSRPGSVVAMATFTCRTVDLDDTADQGDTLTVDGFDYTVRVRLDDGTGMTRLDLEGA